MTNVQLDPDTHTYFDANDPERDYVSVSHVIRRVGLRKSFVGVDRHILDFAAERGIAVENILYDLIRGNPARVDVPQWEQNGKTLRDSVMEFVPGIQKWLADAKPNYQAHQVIVSDDEAGIAGTIDLVTDTAIIDVKATAKEEADWKLQVGAYLWMHGGEYGTFVLHVNRKFKKGYILREYDRQECLDKWTYCREAWLESRAAFRRAKERILEPVA